MKTTQHTNGTNAEMQIKLNTGEILVSLPKTTYICKDGEFITHTKFFFQPIYKSVYSYKLRY